MAVTPQMRTQISQLYVALLGRAPEADGFAFWVSRLDMGASFAQVAQDMFDLPATRADYPSFLTNTEIVTRFYVNVLGTAPYAAALDYWTAQLNSKTKGTVIADMVTAVTGYSGTDPSALESQSLFNNKVAVGLKYAVEMIGNNIAEASALLPLVTAGPHGQDAANAQIAVFFNHVPVLSAVHGDNPAFIVGSSSAVKLDTGTAAAVSDADHTTFGAAGYVRVAQPGNGSLATGNFSFDGTTVKAGDDGVITAGERVTVGGTDIGVVSTIAAASAVLGERLKVSFDSNAATPALVSTLLRNLYYTETSSNLATGGRTFDVSVNDGIGTSATATVTVTGSPPTTTSGGTTAFTEGAAVASIPVAIDAGLTLADVDNTTLAAATVSITGNFQSGQDVLAFTNNGSTMGNIASSYNAGTGALTLASSGATATKAQWQAALRSVTYGNSSDAPDTGNRTVSFAINDGSTSSSVGAKTVSVTAVNDAPTLAATSATATFTYGPDPIAGVDLFSGVTTSTVETGQSILGLTLTVSHVTDTTDEYLRIGNTYVQLVDGSSGSSSSGSDARSFTVSVAGGTATVAWTFSNGAGGGLDTATVQSLIDGITYSNRSQAPHTADPRVITLASLQDNGGTANGGQDTMAPNLAATVTVNTPPQPPVISSLDGDSTVAALGSSIPTRLDTGTAVSITDSDSTDFDGGSLSASFVPFAPGRGPGSIVSGYGNFSFDGTLVQAGTDGVITAAEIVSVGGTPIGTVTINGQTGAPLRISLNASATPDRVATLLHNLYYLEGASGIAGDRSISIQLIDGSSPFSAGGTLRFTVDTPPVITSNGGGATATINVAENSTAVTTVTATDADAGQAISYTLSGGADLAKFSITNSGVLTFIAAPNFEAPTDSNSNNSYLVEVTASDGLGGTAVQALTVSVTDVNETSITPPAPTPIPDPTPNPVPNNHGLPDVAVEDAAPGLPSANGGTPVLGDGNGDGIKDSAQAEVATTTFQQTNAVPGTPARYASLVADSTNGIVDSTDGNTANITSFSQKDAPANLPSGVDMPLGLISFTATVGLAPATGNTPAPGIIETFSLFVDDSLGINGYWKQNVAGTWVNLASDIYGGKATDVGTKLRLDFQIQDGGEFDADHKVDGIIIDPGAAAYVPPTLLDNAPHLPHDGFWF